MSGQSLRWRVNQVGDVLADVPVFMTSPIHRRWHLNWGATTDEVRAGMPGDEHLAGAQFRATRAIAVAAPRRGCVVLLECGDLAMNRRMMRGIESQAETLAREGRSE